MENNSNQPLIISSNKLDDDNEQFPVLSSLPRSFTASFVADSEDIPPITDARGFYKAFAVESIKLWYLAGPAVFTIICQYAMGAVTQIFAGHVGTLDLAAFSVENSIIAGLCFGIMWGMGSALETLCGQAYGAGQIDMLGVYLQRSWVIVLASSILLTFLYIFAEPFLILLGQDEEISRAAGRFALWMIPQLYAYAIYFPTTKFLQAQSKIMVMAWFSGLGLVFHVFFSWLLMLKLGWGMAGGAVVLNVSWWIVTAGQLVYIFIDKCGGAWTGFSWMAFSNLWGFTKLSLASGVMLCLESWYFTALILFAGYLKNAEIAVDALSICTNILGFVVMVAVGLNAAISVRVSNELGAAHPRTAKFSIIVVVVYAFVISMICAIALLIFQNHYPSLFSESYEVKDIVYRLTPLLAFCMVLNNIQPALSGVAVGAGWQTLVAYVNIICYYLFGIPMGLVLGFTFDKGVEGIWYGMVGGTAVQTLILFLIVYRTNWNKEASIAGKRIKKWRGEGEAKSKSRAEII